jgi:peptide/nickel transport system permease protein
VSVAVEAGRVAPRAASVAERFGRRPAARIALGVLGVMVLGSVLAPVLVPHGRDTIVLEERAEPPSRRHLFGTDDLGRDLMSRVLHAGRVSLGVAAVATVLAVGLGAALGLLAGYRGGIVDAIVRHSVDVALCVPTFFVLLLLGSWWGARFESLCLVLGLTSWMPVARLVRASTLAVRGRAHVEAARALGYGTLRTLWGHVLPIASAPILVSAALAGAQAILAESALSFLGLGLQPPTPSWGNMLQEAQAHVFDAPWMAALPGLFVLAAVLALHTIADAWRDALDPKLR